MNFIADLIKDKTDSQRRFLELLIPLWLDVVAQISEHVDTSPAPETLLRELRVRIYKQHNARERRRQLLQFESVQRNIR